jgi:iron complex outermembrane receptor protein
MMQKRFFFRCAPVAGVLSVMWSACAQQAEAPKDKPPSLSETVVVLGDAAPVSVGEAARPVTVQDVQRQRLTAADVEDLVRSDGSVDIQQRAAGGVMNDVSVRGASFEQTLVLLNGLRMDDVETSHFNLDLPVPMAALESVDVLHGAGSTLYGSDAIGGVVDFTTWQPESSTLRLRAGAGSFSEDQEGVLGALTGQRWSTVLAADRDRSEGFTYDRDYRTEDLSSETRFASPLGKSELLFAGDDRVFGANGFYGPYNSWERTKGWFAALTQQINGHDSAAVSYRRHTDEFVLFRNDPAAYENNHIDQSYEGDLRDRREIARNVTLATGLQETADQIDSTNLGDHGRNRGAGYADVEWRVPGRGSLAAGLREEIFSGGRVVSSPMFEATYVLKRTVKVRGAIGYGFRLPTFLDLYYSDPVTRGNPNLQPESAWNYEGGADWYPGTSVAASVTGFTSVQHNTIDYTRPYGTAVYTATNLGSLQFSGVESSLEWRVSGRQSVKLSWTFLHGSQGALGDLQSEYVFNYAVNNGRAAWTWRPKRGLLVQSRLGVLERYSPPPNAQQAPYAVWDVSAARQAGRWHPYLLVSNLANTGYAEITGPPPVQMPGRSFTGGVEFVLTKTH